MYKKAFMPDHPNAKKDGTVFSHRIIAEQYLGRYLRKEEVVHHINEHKEDNRIENLIVFEDQQCHSRYHRTFVYNDKRAPKCGRAYKTREFYSSIDWGIVLYGPNCKKKKEKLLRELAERTKRDLKIG